MTDALALRSADFLSRARATAAQLVAALPVLPLETPEHEAKAGLLLRAIATLRAEGEALRKEEKAPHLAAGRAVDDRYKAPDRDLEQVDLALRQRLSEAAKAREAKRQAEIQAAADAARAGQAQEANAAIVRAQEAVRAPIEGIGEGWTWEAVAVDLARVPLSYLSVDMSKVRAEVASANREGRPPEIAGITFERKPTFRVGKL